jgi:plasmid stability protein
MRRLQIMIEDETYRALSFEAAREGVSMATLVRDYLRSGLPSLPPLSEDPLLAFAGSVEFDGPADIDDVVYPR